MKSIINRLLVVFLALVVVFAAIALVACDPQTDTPNSNKPISGKPSNNNSQINPPLSAIDVTSISVSLSQLNMTVGEQQHVSVSVFPSNASDKSVVWKSSNASVATVSDGIITALSNGTAIITATSSNGKSATCSITVKTEVDSGR